MSEHTEQTLLTNWAARMLDLLPELAYLYAVPNGGYRAQSTAVKMKQEGVKKGVPDLHLPVPRGGYIGCWVEMKWGKNKQSEDQIRWMQFLREQGHFYTVCYQWEDAAEILEHYLRGHIAKE
jgi:hypothetical protein